MSTLREIREAVLDMYPTLSGTQARKAASQLFDAGIPATPWNITETIRSGRAPGEAFRVCVGPRHSRGARGGVNLDPVTIGDQRRSDPTANRALRNDHAAALRLGLVNA